MYMSATFIKKSIKIYAHCALSMGLFMTSSIVIALAITAYIIHASIKV
jgi:hypothetical protein